MKALPLLPCKGGMDNFNPDLHEVFAVGATPAGGLTPPERWRVLRDVDLWSDGVIATRPGVVVERALVAPQGLWEIDGRLFHQAAGSLFEGGTELVSGLSKRVVLQAHAEGIFGTDGTKTFKLFGQTVETWGLPVPRIALTPGTGSLSPGVYRVQTTFVDVEGNEGGTSPAANITLTTATGIQVVVEGARPGVVAVNIYASEPGQKETSFVEQVALGAMPGIISSVGVTRADPPTTEQMSGVPAGTEGLLSFWAFLIAWRGNAAFRSEAHEPHLFHGRKIMQFPAAIRAAEGLQNGMWFGTAEGIWWVHGEDPTQWVPELKSVLGVAWGSKRVDGSWFPKLQTRGVVALFLTSRGVVVGTDDGVLIELSAERYHFELTSTSRASFAVVNRGTLRQLFVTVAG